MTGSLQRAAAFCRLCLEYNETANSETSGNHPDQRIGYLTLRDSARVQTMLALEGVYGPSVTQCVPLGTCLDCDHSAPRVSDFYDDSRKPKEKE